MVVSNSSQTCIEVTGEGRWHVFERECMNLVRHSEHDHITVIVRNPLGGRELVDLGKMGERRAELPSATFRHPFHTESLLGVVPQGHRYRAQVSAGSGYVYLGTYDDRLTAAIARDKYVVEHGIKSRLNFPKLMEMVKADLAEEVTD
jgi:hypothetical protein